MALDVFGRLARYPDKRAECQDAATVQPRDHPQAAHFIFTAMLDNRKRLWQFNDLERRTAPNHSLEQKMTFLSHKLSTKKPATSALSLAHASTSLLTPATSKPSLTRPHFLDTL